jgi:hypothetical protein
VRRIPVVRALVTTTALALLLPLATPAVAAAPAVAPAAPSIAESVREADVARPAAAARGGRILRLVFPRTAVRPPRTAPLQIQQPVHVPGWTARSAAPQLAGAASPPTVQAAAWRTGTHLSSPAVSAQARQYDQQASAWARGLIVRARARTALLSVQSRAGADPTLRSELQRLSLDYLNGLWCGWLQGVVLQPQARPGELTTHEQAFEDAVLARASARLKVAMSGQWVVYFRSLDGLRKDLAGSNRLEGVVMDPSGLLAPLVLGASLYAPPGLERRAGGRLTKGLVAWYRACYALPRL